MRSFLSKLRFVAHACFLFLVAQTAAVAVEVTWDGSGNMTWTQPDNTSWSGSTYQSGDIALFAGAGAGTVTLSTTITPGGVIVSSGTYTNNGSGIGGSGALTVSGGMLILNNTASTYSGTTAVSNGATLQMNLDNLLPYGTGKGDVTVDGLLNLNDRLLTINGLNGAGEIRQPGGSARVLTLGSGDASGTFSGVIRQTAGTLGVTKMGSGTQTLSGTNRYNGVTTVSAGTLVFSNTNTLSGAVVVNAGNLSFTAANTLSGTVTVNTGGTLRVSHATALGQTPRLTLAGGATFNTADLAAPYALGNAQTVWLSGSGVAATLQTGADDGLSLASGCALQFTAYNGATAPLAIAGGGSLTLASSNTVTVTVASASPLAVGDYTLIDGGVDGTAPTTYVTVNGTGRAAATTASLLIAAGDLVLRIEGYPSHTPGSISSAANGPWDVAATWLEGVVPGPGDSVTVSHAVTLSNGTHPLNSFVNNGTLTFSGWNTALKATTITLGGTVTHPTQSDVTGSPGVYADWTPDNRILIEGHDITVSGTVNVDFKGYVGGATPCGPGATAVTSNPKPGAGHGGRGAGTSSYSTGGMTYGSATAPTDPGSGGANSHAATLGNGGGVVRIAATGRVTVNGTISANGQGSGNSWGGRGSGGSVYITCETFAGTGTVRANGGEHNGEEHAGGGGGRVAVVYNTAAQASVSPKPSVMLSAKGGLGRYFSHEFMGDPGTVYVSNASFFPPTTATSGFVPMIEGLDTWSPESFTVNNTWVKFPDGFTLSPTNTLTVNGALARLDVSSNAVIRCRNLTITNSARLYVAAAATNGAAPGYGARVEVSERLNVHANAVLYPLSEPRNGGSVFLSVGNLNVFPGGLIDADGRGFRGADAASTLGYGPGRPTTTAAPSRPASYGGRGGGPDAGPIYGSSNAPALPGSGSSKGYAAEGAAGGGLVWIEAGNTIDLRGTISARGQQGVASHNAGGSGGGIYLICRRWAGSNGILQASGGPSGGENRRGGGGGRIAVWRMTDTYSGTITTNVTGGAGIDFPVGPGTVVFGQIPAPGTLLLLR